MKMEIELKKREQREGSFFFFVSATESSEVHISVTLHLLYHYALLSLLHMIKSSLSPSSEAICSKDKRHPMPFAVAPAVVMATQRVPHMTY